MTARLRYNLVYQELLRRKHGQATKDRMLEITDHRDQVTLHLTHLHSASLHKSSTFWGYRSAVRAHATVLDSYICSSSPFERYLSVRDGTAQFLLYAHTASLGHSVVVRARVKDSSEHRRDNSSLLESCLSCASCPWGLKRSGYDVVPLQASRLQDVPASQFCMAPFRKFLRAAGGAHKLELQEAHTS
jgi:hypothetical protein